MLDGTKYRPNVDTSDFNTTSLKQNETEEMISLFENYELTLLEAHGHLIDYVESRNKQTSENKLYMLNDRIEDLAWLLFRIEAILHGPIQANYEKISQEKASKYIDYCLFQSLYFSKTTEGSIQHLKRIINHPKINNYLGLKEKALLELSLFYTESGDSRKGVIYFFDAVVTRIVNNSFGESAHSPATWYPNDSFYYAYKAIENLVGRDESTLLLSEESKSLSPCDYKEYADLIKSLDGWICSEKPHEYMYLGPTEESIRDVNPKAKRFRKIHIR